MCEGHFQEDTGKFSQHCTDCKGLGKCIGDYREAHCEYCNKHYFAGLSGFPCSCQENGDGDGDDDYFW
jgi:carboxyl-terminal PDZ ligand of neuronal nitric oxide synthase protein